MYIIIISIDPKINTNNKNCFKEIFVSVQYKNAPKI